MLSLLDTVALALWSLAARRPRHGPTLRTFLSTAPCERAAGGALPESLAVALACAGHDATDGEIGRLREQAASALERGRARGIVPVAWGEARYPKLLAAIPDPPVVLWVAGDAGCLALPAVAIVGSRAASPYGIEAGSRLAGELGGAGMTVVSGLARGVDSAAHRGALGADALTIAVLGSGVDVIYPAEHRALADAIAGQGAVVSEYPPGTPPMKQYFPLRNRIISGLSLGVVVIEAAHKSGSLITANRALEQGRHVMAVPGNILSGRFSGSHGLLRDGARVVDGAADVLEELGTSTLRALCAPPRHGDGGRDEVLRVMEAAEPCDLDTLAASTGLEPRALLPRLLDLELAGRVRRAGGGRFVRVR